MPGPVDPGAVLVGALADVVLVDVEDVEAGIDGDDAGRTTTEVEALLLGRLGLEL